MAHITGGYATYERRVKTGEFEYKHAAVNLEYAINEGDDVDAIIATAGALALNHVHNILRGKVDPSAEVVKVPLQTILSGPPVEVARFEVKDEVDDLKKIFPGPDVVPVTNLRAAKRVVKNGPTDKEMQQAASAAAQRLKSNEKVRALINEYAANYYDIPAEKRPEFLGKLQALT